MMDLGKDALALLDSARRADAAPHAARQRVRRRLVNAIAAGTIGTSAALAKGAAYGAMGTAKVGAAVGAGTSITTGLFGAVVTGLALGMVAITPASKRTEEAPVASPTASVFASARTVVPKIGQNRAPYEQLAASGAVPPSEALPVSSAATAIGASSVARRSAEPLRVASAESEPSLAPANTARNDASSGQVSALGSVGVLPSSKASIARETELLAGVQRALQQGRPATALSILNRYAMEFPAGELQEESVASRVVALCDFGRRDDAARWRAEFFRWYPNSPLSARVRGACSGAAGEK